MKVGILIYPGFSLFEFSCAVELFALSRPELASWYDTKVIAWQGGPFNTTAGITVDCEYVTDFSAIDLLVVPCWNTQLDDLPGELIDSLISFKANNGRVISFCSGAFLLAQAGLLEGRQATTHWRYADLFKTYFPHIDYVDDVLYVYDGEVGCSAGSAAGLDLGIEVIRQDFGFEAANSVARRLVLPAHRQGGQKQFIEQPIEKRTDVFSSTMDWAIEHISLGISVDMLADKSFMSRRSFDRKFRQKFNMSPKQWLINQQIDVAKRILESTNQSIDEVAIHAGFDNAITLRHHFKRLVNISPTRYREQFNNSEKTL